jgi:hypothetical protein
MLYAFPDLIKGREKINEGRKKYKLLLSFSFVMTSLTEVSKASIFNQINILS